MNFDEEDELDVPASRGFFAMSEVIISAMDRITTRAGTRGGVSGIATGYPDLDEIIGGLQGSQLVIIGSRPSMGKTTLALNICEHVLCDEKPVLFVSLEMDELEVMERLLSSKSRVNGYKIRTGKGLGRDDMKQLGGAYQDLHNLPFWIASLPCRTMPQVAADARYLKSRQGLDLILVDYIQLIEPEDIRSSRQKQISRICRQLKQLARELRIPVIALSQLGRPVEYRDGYRPTMSDLVGSEAIAQESDIVILLHRPEYYDPDDQPGTAELIIAKNRMGATGIVRLAFRKDITRFENFERDSGMFDGTF